MNGATAYFGGRLSAAGRWRESARAGSMLSLAFSLFSLSHILAQPLWMAVMACCFVIFMLIFGLDFAAAMRRSDGLLAILASLNPFRRTSGEPPERPADAALAFSLFMSALVLMLLRILGGDLGNWSLSVAPVAMAGAAYNAYRLGVGGNMGLWCALAPLNAACAQGFMALISV